MKGVTQTGLQMTVIDPARIMKASARERSRTPETVLLDKIHETNPQRADALQKHLSDSKQIIDQFHNSRSSAAQMKKKAAAEKIQRIKAEIQILKTMGGDPKRVARQIAQLAKELASAVREYASAGVTSIEIPAPANTAGNASASMAEEPRAIVELTGHQDSLPQAADGGSPAIDGKAAAEGARQYQEARMQQFKQEVQEKGDAINANRAQTRADQEFVREARTLAALLKLLARQMKERLRQRGNHSALNEFESINKALADVEQKLSVISAGVHAAA